MIRFVPLLIRRCTWLPNAGDYRSEVNGSAHLLASPFRYGHSVASRFRRADERPGIFYASEAERTAITETAYWRLRLLRRSPGFLPGNRTSEHLSFSVPVSLARLIDATRPPLSRDSDRWTDPADYTACQNLATAVRAAGGQAIRSPSARDPHGINIALLGLRALPRPSPITGKAGPFASRNTGSRPSRPFRRETFSSSRPSSSGFLRSDNADQAPSLRTIGDQLAPSCNGCSSRVPLRMRDLANGNHGLRNILGRPTMAPDTSRLFCPRSCRCSHEPALGKAGPQADHLNSSSADASAEDGGGRE